MNPNLAVFPGVLGKHRVRVFTEIITEHQTAAVHVRTAGTSAWAQGEPRAYDLLAGTLFGGTPLEQCYHELAELVSDTFCLTVILSPYITSHLNVHIAEGPGVVHGWHRDTNPLTALVYLTDNQSGELETNDGRVVRPSAGTVLIMKGKEVLHQVRSLTTDERRVVMVANFYSPDDPPQRDPRLDSLLYGQNSQERS